MTSSSDENVGRLLHLSARHERYLEVDLRKQESERALAAFTALGNFTEAKLIPPAEVAPSVLAPELAGALGPSLADVQGGSEVRHAKGSSPLRDPNVLQALLDFHRAHQPIVRSRASQQQAARNFARPGAPALTAEPKPRSLQSRRGAGFSTILRASRSTDDSSSDSEE